MTRTIWFDEAIVAPIVKLTADELVADQWSLIRGEKMLGCRKCRTNRAVDGWLHCSTCLPTR